jgi:hypothetical protein
MPLPPYTGTGVSDESRASDPTRIPVPESERSDVTDVNDLPTNGDNAYVRLLIAGLHFHTAPIFLRTLAVHRSNGFDARIEPYHSTRLSRYNAGP